MRWIVLLLLLVSCVPPYQPEQVESRPVEEIEQPVQERQPVVAVATKTVKRVSSGEEAVYGLNGRNELVHVENDREWNIVREDGGIRMMTNPSYLTTTYEDGKLSTFGSMSFFYNARGDLTKVETDRESLRMQYDGRGRVDGVQRGMVKTELFFDNAGKIEKFVRGPTTTQVAYDDRNRTRKLDTGGSQLILGYWRADKLASLSGNIVGPAVTVSYGPGFPPLQASIVHEEDDSRFSSTDPEALFAVVDKYLYCNYVRSGSVFDPAGYVVFHNYVSDSFEDYVLMDVLCEAYER